MKQKNPKSDFASAQSLFAQVTQNPAKPRRPATVAVIGAGSSGLVTLRHLIESGLAVTCFEQGYDVGGLWKFDNSNGRGGAYRSLQINTSKKNTQFSDFPLPDSADDYPHHTVMARYLSDYADHFELRKSIAFAHQIETCFPLPSGGYELHFGDERPKQRFDAVVVANGHHFCPLYPDSTVFDRFVGHVLHSYDYRSPTEPLNLVGQRVLVVGLGNSAVDIACELSRCGAQAVTVAARRGAWIMPKYLHGRPIDGPAMIPHFLPGRLRRNLVTRAFRMIYGKMTDFGLPEPDHLIGEAHPTISTEFPLLVKEGKIAVRPGMVEAAGQTVHFADGSTEEVDAIVFCTGYEISLPFFSADHIQPALNRLPLFYRAFHPEKRHVFFVGLAQTIGAIMPTAEAQAKAIAQHLLGTYNLPQVPQMMQQIQKHERAMAERFVPSLRHTMQVIPEQFIPALDRELKAGAKRARRGDGIPFELSGAIE